MPPELEKYADIIDGVAVKRPNSTDTFYSVMCQYKREIDNVLKKYDDSAALSTIEFIGSLSEHSGNDLSENISNLMSLLSKYDDRKVNDIVPLVTDTFRDILDTPGNYNYKNLEYLYEDFCFNPLIEFIKKHPYDGENNCTRTLADFSYNMPDQRSNLNVIINAADAFSRHVQENDSLVKGPGYHDKSC